MPNGKNYLATFETNIHHSTHDVCKLVFFQYLIGGLRLSEQNFVKGIFDIRNLISMLWLHGHQIGTSNGQHFGDLFGLHGHFINSHRICSF